VGEIKSQTKKGFLKSKQLTKIAPESEDETPEWKGEKKKSETTKKNSQKKWDILGNGKPMFPQIEIKGRRGKQRRSKANRNVQVNIKKKSSGAKRRPNILIRKDTKGRWGSRTKSNQKEKKEPERALSNRSYQVPRSCGTGTKTGKGNLAESKRTSAIAKKGDFSMKGEAREKKKRDPRDRIRLSVAAKTNGEKTS